MCGTQSYVKYFITHAMRDIESNHFLRANEKKIFVKMKSSAEAFVCKEGLTRRTHANEFFSYFLDLYLFSRNTQGNQTTNSRTVVKVRVFHMGPP